MYRRLYSRLAAARREGRFPERIDTVRQVHVSPAWPDATAFVRQIPAWFGLDRTEGQECAVYVAAEKDTLRQLLTGWLAPYGIPVLVVTCLLRSRSDMSVSFGVADPRRR
jgi:hypothetical protein